MKCWKNEQSLRNLRDNTKRSNTCVTRMPEEERKEMGYDFFEEIMPTNFLNLEENMNLKTKEFNKINPK